MTTNRDIYLLIEMEDKKVNNTSIALIEEGKRLSTRFGGELHAIMFGQRFEGIDQLVGTHGASHLYLFNQEPDTKYHPNVFERCLTEILLSKKPYLFLAPASSLGSDLIPRVSAKLQIPMVANCVEIKIGEDVEFIKPIQNGRLHATYVCKGTGTKIATISPNALSVSEVKNQLNIAKVTEVKLNTEKELVPIRVKGFLKADHRTIDITEAEIIVAVGRGIGSKEKFKKIEEFADRIGAAIGGTRPIIDAGILPFDRQIGQTGKIVSPKLIVMLGISGAMEFSKGIENAETKIAVNINRQEPILKSIDLGIVGDLNALIPKIIDHIDKRKKLKKENGSPGPL